MEKILLVPDSFKGTLSSRQVCQVMAGQLRRFFPQAQVKSIPVADGGEGSVEAFLAAAGGERRTRTVTGPFGEPVEAFYGILGDGRTAVIEMAACAGLPLAEGRLNPERATTYGVAGASWGVAKRSMGSLLSKTTFSRARSTAHRPPGTGR